MSSTPAGGLVHGSTHERRVLLVLGLLSGFAPWSIDLYLPGLPELTRDLHTSAAAANLTIAACMVGLALGQLVGGALSDAQGRRRPLLAGLLLYIVTSLACALAPDVWTLVALRLVQGAAGGVGIVIAMAVVRDLYPGNDTARVFAVLTSIAGMAPIVAPIAGGQLLRITSWHGLFVVLAMIGTVLFALAALALGETLPASQRHRGGLAETLRVFRRVSVDPSFTPYCMATALGFGALFAYISASPFVLEVFFGVSPQVFSAVFAGNAVAMIAGAQAAQRLVGRFGPERLLQAGLAGTVLAGGWLVAILVVHPSVGLVIAGLVVLAASVGLIGPTGTALALADQGDAAGSASALLGLTQSGVGAIIAPLVGIAGAHSALPMGVAIAACAVGALAIDRVYRRAGVRRG